MVTGRAFIDLHSHSRASFDSLSAPREMVRAASQRGLTHLAITDHDRIDVALEARDLAPPGLTIIVGEEVKTRDGDLICVFLEHAIAPGMSAVETIAAAREQGGLVGIPHPFDRMRGSLLRDATMASLAPLVDWIETYNARVVGHGNDDAAAFAIEHERPGISVSDAHSIMEIGVAYTALDGDPSTPAGLLAALPTAEIVPGRASYFLRLWTPVAKGINRARGNGRVRPVAAGMTSGRDRPA
jgi:predicted metal-dependent phosphoesterase TrpH